MNHRPHPLAALCACFSAGAAVFLRMALSTAVLLIGSLILLYNRHKERKHPS